MKTSLFVCLFFRFFLGWNQIFFLAGHYVMNDILIRTEDALKRFNSFSLGRPISGVVATFFFLLLPFFSFCSVSQKKTTKQTTKCNKQPTDTKKKRHGIKVTTTTFHNAMERTDEWERERWRKERRNGNTRISTVDVDVDLDRAVLIGWRPIF